MSTLYRKYRPQNFSSMVGQEHIIQTITNQISTDKIAHAYLFSGPRGIGKTSIARLLAKAINCENRKEKEFEPCDKCSSCTEISNSRNIDVIEMDAASNTGVDNVRENIIENAQFKPTKAKYKIFIIDEVHMLSTSAFNALLKTLEEPPSHAIFILATTELHKLPATIISRCQRFNFKKITEKTIAKKLQEICKKENIEVDEKVIERVINKSDGCLRDAESLLGQVLSLNLDKITSEDAALILPTIDLETALNYLDTIAQNNAFSAIKILDRLLENGNSIEQFSLDLLNISRDIMITQTGNTVSNSDYNDISLKQIQKLSKELPQKKLIHFIDSLIKRRFEIKQATIPQLPLELLAVEFCSGESSPTASSLPSPRKLEPKEKHNNVSDVIAPKPPTPSTQSEVSQEKQIELSSVQDKSEESHEKQDKANNEIPVSTVPTREEGKTITIEELKSKWSEIMKNLGTTSPSIIFSLRTATILKLENQKLTLEFPYSLHKEKVELVQTKNLIESCIEKILGQKITLSCSLAEKKPETTNVDITNLAADFGGEVVG